MKLGHITRRTAVVGGLATWASSSIAQGQPWPAKPIRLVVPFPPGGSADSVARLMGTTLSERLGQPVIIDNKPGGNLFIGATETARAAPDGYTLMMTLDIAFTVNPFVFSKVPYRTSDFAPVSQITTQSMWFVTRADSPIKSMSHLVTRAKAQPGRLNYGSGALIGQLTGELLKTLTGASMTYVAYKGSALAAQSLLGGELDLVVSDITPLLPFIQEGRLVALGHTGTARSPILPQVPTMVEQGFKDFHSVGWFGLFAPAGTPSGVINRLAAEVERALARPEIKDRIKSFGLQATSSTPAALSDSIKHEAASWEKVIRTANIKLD